MFFLPSQVVIVSNCRYPALEYLNTFSPRILEVLACNTNVSIGDRAHTFYVTLYTSKDTNPEDTQLWQRVAASMGRRVWNQMVTHEGCTGAWKVSVWNPITARDSGGC